MHRSVPLTLVLCLAGALPAAAQTGPHAPRTRTYYVAADEVQWNYMPTGMDQIRGIPLDSARPQVHAPATVGPVLKKAVYREYTDSSFATVKVRPPEWEHLGLLGPVLRGEVGDTLRVVFRNNGTHPYSMHPHGLFYDKGSEGTPYRDGTSAADKADDAVPPGGTHTYVWAVPERAGPGPGDGSSVMWMYHSHVEEGLDVDSGLMGPIIVTARGQARPDGTPVDVDREFVVDFEIMPEGLTHYTAENLRATAPWANADSLARDDAFQNDPRNYYAAMNGYIWGNLPGLQVVQGERVRWYLMANTTENDFHTPHWHGNTVLVHGMRMDIVSVEPMMMLVADMVPDNPGIWLFHCHVRVHMEEGMAARYTVLPRDPAARPALLAAARPLQTKADPAALAGPLPAGWRARPDQLDARGDGLHFVAMGDGVHATLGTAAVFYQPTLTAQGRFRAGATFTQTRPCQHPEAYGLLLGGRDLDGPLQSYLYFVIRQDGRYMIRHRAGAELHTLVDWTPQAAIRTASAGVPVANRLEVEVLGDHLRFLVNGTEVATLPRDPRYVTDGIVGLRINHNLDVHVGKLEVASLAVGDAVR